MTEQEYQVTRLNREEFSSALQKGLGRALLHVKTYGLDGVDDLVLAACLKRQGYDFQTESSREPWLFQMFVGSNYQPRFRATILNYLKEETDAYDLQQLCEFAKELASLGDHEARAFLWVAVQRSAVSRSYDDWAGADVWEALEGNEGILQLARIYGQRLLLNPEDAIPIGVFSIEDQDLKELLKPFVQTEPEIKAYWDYLAKHSWRDPLSIPINKDDAIQRHRQRVRQKHSVASILDNARNKIGEYPSRYLAFGRYATADELEEIFASLLSESDDEIRLRLLWVFVRTPLPRFDEKILHWADAAEGRQKRAAIAALSHLRDQRVHKLARSKVCTGSLLGEDSSTLELFLNNYEPDDASLITKALFPLKPDADDAHDLGFSIIDLAEKYEDVELTELLKWVYETTPCSNCRERIVKLLHQLHQLDPVLLYECQFDCSEDIRDFTKQTAENP